MYHKSINMKKYIDFSLKVPSEWDYFREWCRRFDTNSEDKRYGILIMGAELLEENMIYAADPKELRQKHIDHLIVHPELLEGTIDDFRNFLDWLEGQEGKGPVVKRGLLS